MTPLLDVRGLTKHYAAAHGRTVRALEDVSFTLAPGEVLGVVGESGCGKSTLGRTVLRLAEPTAGQVLFDGEDIAALPPRAMNRRRRDMQIVFQDPFGSLNPRHRVARILAEPLVVHGEPNAQRRVEELLAMVGLPPGSGARYPRSRRVCSWPTSRCPRWTCRSSPRSSTSSPSFAAACRCRCCSSATTSR